MLRRHGEFGLAERALLVTDGELKRIGELGHALQRLRAGAGGGFEHGRRKSTLLGDG
jgi:hypothetical protein